MGYTMFFVDPRPEDRRNEALWGLLEHDEDLGYLASSFSLQVGPEAAFEFAAICVRWPETVVVTTGIHDFTGRQILEELGVEWALETPDPPEVAKPETTTVQ